ncbi:hypothetical protein A2U01_0056574, partial [Trifolium medium]|nr:hypothetical protein [Trifolium medium]
GVAVVSFLWSGGGGWRFLVSFVFGGGGFGVVVAVTDLSWRDDGGCDCSELRGCGMWRCWSWHRRGVVDAVCDWLSTV